MFVVSEICLLSNERQRHGKKDINGFLKSYVHTVCDTDIDTY